MARIHLVVGPVGAGKSTFVAELCSTKTAIALDLDDWMARLFRADRPVHDVMPWYLERVERCIEQIWSVTESVLANDTDVVLEIGLIRRLDRQALYKRAEEGGHMLVVHVIDAPREIRRARGERRNQERGETFSMEVPPAVFELASDMWEPLDETECEHLTIHRVARDERP
ncbi:MAG: ATP-binding protein [Nannocystaceae bacterium]